MASSRHRGTALVKTARDIRAKQAKFKAKKKAAIKELRALKTAVKSAELKLKDKAASTSALIAKFNSSVEDGAFYVHYDEPSEAMRFNPRLQTNIDLSDILEAIDEIITGIQEIEK